MKQFEVIRQRLPRGIDVRISSKNVLSFRVRFRKKGYPEQIKTFPEEKLAKQWLAEQERNALLGIHFPHIRSCEHRKRQFYPSFYNPTQLLIFL